MTLLFHIYRGSAIAKIVGANAGKLDVFDTTVNMWVFEEMVNGRKLTEIINTDHENVKYLPGHKLPPNIVRLIHFSHSKYSGGGDVFVLIILEVTQNQISCVANIHFFLQFVTIENTTMHVSPFQVQ